MAALIEEQLNQMIEIHGLPPGFPAEGGALALGNRTLRIAPGLTRRQMGVEIARRLMRDWYAPAGGPRQAALPVAAPGAQAVKAGTDAPAAQWRG